LKVSDQAPVSWTPLKRLSVPASDANYATLGDQVDISMGRDSGNRNVIFRWKTVSHGVWYTAFEGTKYSVWHRHAWDRVASGKLLSGLQPHNDFGRVAAADVRGFNVAVSFALGIENKPSTARVHVSDSGTIPHK
jgi:hypothetical protein